MVARELGLTPGTFTWKPVNIQLYDRHIDQAIEMIEREPVTCRGEIKLDEKVERFEDVKPDSISLEDYPRQLIKTKNPQLSFPLGI
jgi:thymidylate synthase